MKYLTDHERKMFACRSLLDESAPEVVAELLETIGKLRAALEEAREEGRKEERAAVVAWLRALEPIRGSTVGAIVNSERNRAIVQTLADAIEKWSAKQ